MTSGLPPGILARIPLDHADLELHVVYVDDPGGGPGFVELRHYVVSLDEYEKQERWYIITAHTLDPLTDALRVAQDRMRSDT
jgi:hypothetical protein